MEAPSGRRLRPLPLLHRHSVTARSAQVTAPGVGALGALEGVGWGWGGKKGQGRGRGWRREGLGLRREGLARGWSR